MGKVKFFIRYQFQFFIIEKCYASFASCIKKYIKKYSYVCRY